MKSSHVIKINKAILDTGTGLKGNIDSNRLEGALGRVEQYIYYEEISCLFVKAAKYAEAIANAHAFSDGNKRTGLICALQYLAVNGKELETDNECLAYAMVDLVTKKISVFDFSVILFVSHQINNEV